MWQFSLHLVFIYTWIQRWSKEIFWNGDSSPTLYSFLLTCSVTRFTEISPLWPFWMGSFSILQNFQIIFVNFICCRANFHCCKWPKIQQTIYLSGHTATDNRVNLNVSLVLPEIGLFVRQEKCPKICKLINKDVFKLLWVLQIWK